jgi:hypothetical protein
MNIKPDKYEIVFASDRIKYLRRDSKISTNTEIMVCKNHHAEIRKITFKNDSEFVEALYNNFRSNEIVNDISISDDPKCDIDKFIKHLQIIDIKLQKDVNELLDTINNFKNYIQNGESGLENDSEEISRVKMHNIRAILFLYSQLYAARVDAIIEYTKKYIDIYKALCAANREEEN